jgi:hypothetical protein
MSLAFGHKTSSDDHANDSVQEVGRRNDHSNENASDVVVVEDKDTRVGSLDNLGGGNDSREDSY